MLPSTKTANRVAQKSRNIRPKNKAVEQAKTGAAKHLHSICIWQQQQ